MRSSEEDHIDGQMCFRTDGLCLPFRLITSTPYVLIYFATIDPMDSLSKYEELVHVLERKNYMVISNPILEGNIWAYRLSVKAKELVNVLVRRNYLHTTLRHVLVQLRDVPNLAYDSFNANARI